MVLGIYLVVLGLSLRSTERPGELGVTAVPCAGGHCLDWVLPAGQAWHDRARPGMRILSVDGTLSTDVADWGLALGTGRAAEVVDQAGRILSLRVTYGSMGKKPIRTSLWVLGGIFAVLGSLVLVRRPDLRAARAFVLFATAMSVGLTVGPAAGGPHPTWAMAVQFAALCGVGMTFLPLAVAMRDRARYFPTLLGVFSLVAGLIFSAYVLVLIARPASYGPIRAILAIYLLVSVIGALVVLSIGGVSSRPIRHRRHNQLCLVGLALGALPVLTLTFTPVALGRAPLLASHVAVLFMAVVPVAFVGAILQYEFLGIRKLFHRGLVHGLTSLGVLVVIAFAVSLATGSDAAATQARVAGLVVLGAITFCALQPVSRRLIDRLFYNAPVDYGTLAHAMRSDLSKTPSAQPAVQAIVDRIVRLCDLESALLFLGRDPESAALVACAGERHAVLSQAYPALQSRLRQLVDEDLIELRWESNTLLAASLVSSGGYLGHVLWGPKRDGEIFLDEEKEVLAIIPAILGLMVDKSALSDELRELNFRLVQAQELERRRLASDLHDGPLQKALILGHPVGRPGQDLAEVARELVVELREVCARLRPSILDDLGLVPALEWLLEELAKRDSLACSLTTAGVGESERLPPATELTLFRVIQEATTNASKHARAATLQVSLDREGGAILATVKDDGVGFRPDDTAPGFGLTGMRERVVQAGGSLSVRSSTTGTVVLARVPVPLVGGTS